MSRNFILTLALILAGAGQAHAAKVSPEAIVGVQKAIKAMGCKVVAGYWRERIRL
jgi:hypothetical protein